MSLNASDSFPSGKPTLDGMMVMATPADLVYPVQFTNLTVGCSDLNGAGPTSFSFAAEMVGTSAWVVPIGTPHEVSFTVALTGSLSVFTVTDNSPGSASSCVFNLSTTGQVDQVRLGGAAFQNQINYTAAQATELSIELTAGTAGSPNGVTVTADASVGLQLDGDGLLTITDNLLAFSSAAATHITLPLEGIAMTGGRVEFDGAFDAANVNLILARFVGASTGGALVIGGTSASPTGQGVTDAATLVAHGVSVSTN